MKKTIKRMWVMVISSCTLLIFVAIGFPAQKQAAQKPLGKWARHYYNRVKIFKQENAHLKNIVLLGDSLTEGFSVEKYFPGMHVLNRGIIADHVGIGERGVLKRLDCSVFDCNPSSVFLMIGVNDLGDYNSTQAVERVAKCYRNICITIIKKMPDVKLYLESCLPTGKKYTRLNPAILALNTRIKKIADELGLTYIDLHSLMKDEKGGLKSEFTREGLHLTPAGYKVWRKALEHYLPPVIGTKRTGMTSSR